MTLFSSATEALKGAIKEGACFILDNAGDAAQWLGDQVVEGSLANNFARGLQNQICNTPPDDTVDIFPTDYTGGQCAGFYRVDFTALRTNDGATNGGFANVRGPLGRKFQNVPDGLGNEEYGIFGRDSSGNSIPVPFASYPPSDNWILTITAVTPFPGVPNNCGDPPPNIPPSAPITVNIDVDYTDEGVDITVPVGIIFAPVYVALDGTINAPISVDFGGLTFDGTVELSPNFEVNINPTGGKKSGGKSDDNIDPTDPVPPPDYDPAPEDDGNVIIGVWVTAQVEEDGPSTVIPFVNGPSIYAPRLGSVTFAIKGSNFLAWTPDQSIKNNQCYIPCPALQGAVAVRVTPSERVTLTYSPVRGRPAIVAS